MIKHLVKMGNRHLYSKAQPVTEFDTPTLHQLVEDLRDTMKDSGAVGIAAPQIGIDLQVIVFGFEKSSRYPHANPVPETVLINPSYVHLSDDAYEDWEGCLSVKGLRGLTTRYTHIQYQGFDIFGQPITKEAQGFHARLVQHEIDHLKGTLFVERVRNLKDFGFEDEIVELMQTKGSKLG